MPEKVRPIVLQLAEAWLQAKRYLAMDLPEANGWFNTYLENMPCILTGYGNVF